MEAEADFFQFLHKLPELKSLILTKVDSMGFEKPFGHNGQLLVHQDASLRLKFHKLDLHHMAVTSNELPGLLCVFAHRPDQLNALEMHEISLSDEKENAYEGHQTRASNSIAF